MARKLAEKGLSEELDFLPDFEPGKVLKGVYHGTHQLGEYLCHLITPEGEVKTKAFWGSSDLNRKLADLVNKYVEVTYKEEKKLAGGRTLKVFKVEYEV